MGETRRNAGEPEVELVGSAGMVWWMPTQSGRVYFASRVARKSPVRKFLNYRDAVKWVEEAT
jgi:hypothetical protein